MQLIKNLEISKCCAFSGPRPEKITENIEDIKHFLKLAIIDSINEGYLYFITGMSRGFDLWAAKCIIELSKSYNIHLVCAIPFLDQDINWSKRDKTLYNDILMEARYTICLSDNFIRGIYHERNRFMINNSSKLITYYNNSQGGTKYTIDYAKKFGKPVSNIFNTQIKFNI